MSLGRNALELRRRNSGNFIWKEGKKYGAQKVAYKHASTRLANSSLRTPTKNLTKNPSSRLATKTHARKKKKPSSLTQTKTTLRTPTKKSCAKKTPGGQIALYEDCKKSENILVRLRTKSRLDFFTTRVPSYTLRCWQFFVWVRLSWPHHSP